eukprot:267218-Prymnesium_polylepis.1
MSARAREHAGSTELPGLRRQSVSGPGRTRTAAARLFVCDNSRNYQHVCLLVLTSIRARPGKSG